MSKQQQLSEKEQQEANNAVSKLLDIAFNNAASNQDVFLNEDGFPILSSGSAGQTFRDIHGELTVPEIFSKLNPNNILDDKNPDRSLDFLTILLSVDDNKDKLLSSFLKNESIVKEFNVSDKNSGYISALFKKKVSEGVSSRLNSGQFISRLNADKDHPVIKSAIERNVSTTSQDLSLVDMVSQAKSIVKSDKTGTSIDMSLPISEFVAMQMSMDNSDGKSILELSTQENIRKTIKENPVQASLEIKFSQGVLQEEIKRLNSVIENGKENGYSRKEMRELNADLKSYIRIGSMLLKIEEMTASEIELKISNSKKKELEVANLMFKDYADEFIAIDGRYDKKDKEKLLKNHQFLLTFSSYLKKSHPVEFKKVADEVQVDVFHSIEKLLEKERQKLERHLKNPFGVRDKNETCLHIECDNPFHKIFNPQDEEIKKIGQCALFKNMESKKMFFSMIPTSGRKYCDENGNVLVEQTKGVCYLKNSVQKPEDRVQAIADSAKIILAQSKGKRERLVINFAKHENKEVREQMAEKCFEEMFEHFSRKSGVYDSTKLTDDMMNEIYTKMKKGFKANSIDNNLLINQHKEKMLQRKEAKLETNLETHMEDPELVESCLKSIDIMINTTEDVKNENILEILEFISDAGSDYQVKEEDGYTVNQVMCRLNDLQAHIEDQIIIEKEVLKNAQSNEEKEAAKAEIDKFTKQQELANNFEIAFKNTSRKYINEQSNGINNTDVGSVLLTKDGLEDILNEVSSTRTKEIKREIAEKEKLEAEKQKGRKSGGGKPTPKQ